ncbi:solute carrier family 2 member 9, like 1 [Lampris incognitus]|uniref:solute carrier family 2 member 9, like 1 n=1 Tax=Lampris incognitus TaxID=2546036 RepID=UPI0024B5DD62|nr:solute carrier family 2 member 9, like 1 [Lampris incognitus]
MEILSSHMTRGNALFFVVILGLGGSFQNGFHITGISSPSPFIQGFINRSLYERYKTPPSPQTVTLIWSAIVSLFAIGGLLGALSVKIVAGRFGRKKAMMGNNFISILAAAIMLTSKSADSFEMIVIARFLYGFTAALGTSIHTIYLGESSPKNLRGMVILTSGIFLSVGKLSGQFFGLSEILGGEELWNILLCIPTCLSVVQLLTLPFFPEAPRYSLIEKDDPEACKKALQILWGQGDYKGEIDDMLAEQKAMKGVQSKSPLDLLRDRSVRWQLIVMVVIIFCSQFSGISAISVFSFDIFLRAGIPREKIRYVTLGVGACEVLTYISCGLLIDRVGRRPLLWAGFSAMSTIMVLITITLNLRDSNNWVPYVTVSLIILFIIFYGGGPAGATSSLSHEIFIQSNRAAAFVLLGTQRWLGFALLGLIFPFLIDALKSYCFVLFACMSLLGSLYTFFMVPETKEKTLMEISEEFEAITICGKSFSKDKTMETKL